MLVADAVPNTRRDCTTCIVRHPGCFCHLPADALRELQSIGRSITLQKSEQLLHEGDAPDTVHLVCAGHIKLYTTSSEGRVLLLRLASPGDIIGLSSALRGSLQKLTAEALDACALKSIPRAQFLQFTERFRDVSRNAALSTAQEYETALLSARRLALSNTAAAKLAGLLVELAHLNRSKHLASVEIPMPLTHEELGSMCGLSRETVTRVLARFRVDGILDQSRGHLILHKLDALEELAA